MFDSSIVKFYDIFNKEILHHDPLLYRKAEFVSITFMDQKNGHKYEMRAQHRTSDSTLCPVRSWIGVIQRIPASPNTDGSTTVKFFYNRTAKPIHQVQ
jgi:hypothetical protein